MRIYLLNPPFTPRFGRAARWQSSPRGGTLYYPIWQAYATGVLEERYQDVRLVDAPAWRWDKEQVLADIRSFHPDLLVIDTSFSSLTNDISVAEGIKTTIPQLKTVVVGPPASQFADRILASDGVDIVARFEYDLTLRDIAQATEQDSGLTGITGISYKQDGEVLHNPDREFINAEDLDRLPFVSKVYEKHLNIKDYFLNHALFPEVQIFTSRGCPNLCTFCSWPDTFSGREYRARSIANVADEFKYVSQELPQVKEIFLEDDTFTIDTKRVRAFCEELQKRRLKISWSCNARANLDYETMKAMKAAGCRLLDVGYESGSDDILKSIKKGISTDRMRKFARDARKAGLLVLGDFIFGLPGETRETAEETIRFAKELKPNIAQFAVATPIPGTKFYEWAKTGGYLLTTDLNESLDKGGFQRSIVSYPEFTNEDIERYVDKALKRYYLSPSYLPIAMRNIWRKNGWHELKGMVKSAWGFLKYLRR